MRGAIWCASSSCPAIVLIRSVSPLIESIRFGGLIANKAFDSNHIITDLNERGAKIVISQHPRRVQPLPLDRKLHK